jgi:methylated-DNA-protein-cysteine methyltransferase-like protein
MNQEFLDAVLYILGQIPKGKVTTYGKIAKLANFPTQSRQVGKVLSSLPKDTELPWHRVINAQGRISFPEHSEKFQQQKSRLEEEGIALLNNRIKLGLYGWPDA